MDIERLAQQAAEAINGGEFNNGKWYTEGQRQAWRKAMTPAADEIERLRKEKTELIKALEFYANPYGEAESVPDFYSELDFGELAQDAIAKATGDE